MGMQSAICMHASLSVYAMTNHHPINFSLLLSGSSGRVDALDPSAVTPDGRLPNADVGEAGTDPDDAAHLRTIFGRMGFNDQEVSAKLILFRRAPTP